MNKKPSIVLMGNSSWSMFNFRKELLIELNKSYAVTVIAPIDEYSKDLLKLGVEYQPIEIDNKGVNPLKDLLLVKRLRKLLESIKPDFLITYTIKPNIYATYVAKKLSIPCLTITTGLGHTFENKSVVGWLVKKMFKKVLKHSSRVLFLNKEDQNIFIDNKLVPVSKTKFIPGEGINATYFQRQTVYTEELRFLFLGRLIWNKGFKEFAETAIKIKQEYPNVQFDVVGFVNVENPEAVPESYIQDLVDQEILNYMGPTNDVRKFLEKSTCLVFPSFYREGLPRVLMEASAMELPIITTDNVGCRDVVINNKTGFIVPTQNISELCNKVVEIIRMNYDQRRDLGINGRKFVIESFSSDMVNRLIIEEINI